MTPTQSPINPEIYFSFFMFTADLQPENTNYTKLLTGHMHALIELGYTGFDVHIASKSIGVNYQEEIAGYIQLRQAFDKAGLEGVKFTTNVGTTRTFDPTSPYREQRESALAYLKSRVDITFALGGESIMSGPFLYPYGVFPLTDTDEPIWSDDLQDWMKPRFEDAREVFLELDAYASKRGVTLAIEPVKSWEMPPPNMVSEVLDFLETIEAPTCGVTFDTAQILMESQGPLIFKQNIARAADKRRLSYVHISAPDRGAIHDSWIPWKTMLGEVLPIYDGPYLIEVFNAIPPFGASMRMARRRFWRPGEDEIQQGVASAYDIARLGIETFKEQIQKLSSSSY